MVFKIKICKKCRASFIPFKNEDYCLDCHYPNGNRVHPETERHEKIIKKGKEKTK